MGVSGYFFRVGVLGALMLAMVALSAAVATAEAQPDASCQVEDNSNEVVGNVLAGPGEESNIAVAQTFVAGNGGPLTTANVTAIDVNNTGSLVMEIRSATLGTPGPTVLASTSISADQIGETYTTVSGRFSPEPEVAVDLVDGQHYALVLRSSDGSFWVASSHSSSSSCPGMVFWNMDGEGFVGFEPHDLIFSVFANEAPVLTNDSYASAQDKPLRVAAPGLLSNDSDPEGDAFTAAKVTDPAHGEVFVNAAGSFAYFPDEGYLGTDSFAYKAKDGSTSSDPATVEIMVKDATKPTISPVSPKPTSTTRDTTPTIKAAVKDNTTLGEANIRLYVAGAPISATKWSYSPSTGTLVYNSPKLSTGKKTVKIVATDAARNVGTKSWYFTIG